MSFPSLPLAAVTPDAPLLLPQVGWLAWLTNSMFVAVVVAFLIIYATRRATARMQLIPGGFQNGFEAVVEFLYNQVEAIVGPKVAPRAFPLLATFFLFILISNWMALVPGIGTVGFLSAEGGYATKTGFLTLYPEPDVPILRPATADLNMTLGLAATFMILWLYVTLKEMGLWGFMHHMFGPKGGLKGLMGKILIPMFLFVGVIELISIAFRPASLSLRLFGNVFAGETLLHEMAVLGQGLGAIGGFITSVLFPLPFYFFELLIGLLQATVFALLCAVYIQLSTTHDDHGDDHAEDH